MGNSRIFILSRIKNRGLQLNHSNRTSPMDLRLISASSALLSLGLIVSLKNVVSIITLSLISLLFIISTITYIYSNIHNQIAINEKKKTINLFIKNIIFQLWIITFLYKIFLSYTLEEHISGTGFLLVTICVSMMNVFELNRPKKTYLLVGAILTFIIFAIQTLSNTNISLNIITTVCFALVAQSIRIKLFDFIEKINIKTTDNELMVEKLSSMAYVDVLTSLYNRRYFNIRIDDVLALKQVDVYLIIIDIDYFKQYNDSLGHVAGDQCLMKIAKSLASSLRGSSDEVFRYGGEEFAIILKNITKKECEKLCLRIKNEINSLKIIHPTSLANDYVTVSQGSCSLMHWMNISDFISAADENLYISKNSGRNTSTVT